MSWAKLCDHMDLDPDLLEVHPDAFAYFVGTITYSSRHLTDGFIKACHAPDILRFKGKRKINVKRALAALTASGFLQAEEGGWRIKNYLKYNPSRVKVLAERERARIKVSTWRKDKTLKKANRPAISDNRPNRYPVTAAVCNQLPDPVPVTDQRSLAHPHKNLTSTPEPSRQGGGDPARSSARESTRHPPPPPVGLAEPETSLYSSQGPVPAPKVTQPVYAQQGRLQVPCGDGVLALRQAPPRPPDAPALNALRKRIAVGPDGQEPEPPTGRDPYCRTTAQRPKQAPEILAAHTLRMDGDATAPDDAPLRLADLVKLFCETYTVKLGHTVTQNELKMMRELEDWHVTQSEALLAYEDARQYAAGQGDKPGLTLILLRLKKLAGRRAAQQRGVDTGQMRVQDKTEKQRAYEIRLIKEDQDLQGKAQALYEQDRLKAEAKRSRS